MLLIFFSISRFSVESKNNRSGHSFEDVNDKIATVPPCQERGREAFEVLKCCELLSKSYNHSNVQQIMILMKYSLDLSRPWIPQYHKQDLNDGNEVNFDFNRLIHQNWFVENNHELLKLFPTEEDIDFFQQFG